MKTYPIMLDVRGRLCVVVGAGPVGLRKAAALRSAGATVRLVDPAEPDGLAADGLEVVRRPYDKGVLAGAFLVFACTDDRTLNARIAADARAAGALVNSADAPEQCDFFAPSVISAGDVVVAIGTGGSAPGLAAHLKRKLRPHLPAKIGQFASALRELRDRLQHSAPDAALRAEVAKALAGEEGYDAFLRGGPDALARLAEEKLAQARLTRSGTLRGPPATPTP